MIKLTQNIISILVLVLLSNYSFGKNISKSNRVIDGDTIILNSKKIRFLCSPMIPGDHTFMSRIFVILLLISLKEKD